MCMQGGSSCSQTASLLVEQVRPFSAVAQMRGWGEDGAQLTVENGLASYTAAMLNKH